MNSKTIYNISKESFSHMNHQERYNLLFDEINQETKDKFKEYLKKKIGLYNVFEKVALIAHSKGKERLSATDIMRYLRSRSKLFQGNYGDYELSDNYTNLIVRFFTWKNPDYLGLFDIRPVLKEQRRSPSKVKSVKIVEEIEAEVIDDDSDDEISSYTLYNVTVEKYKSIMDL